MSETATPHPDFLRLEYETLVDEYENRLETLERGFEMEHEFLDMWVPDQELGKSLYNLFEAASLAGLEGLAVGMDEKALDALDGEELLRNVRLLGGVDVTTGDGRAVMTVAFDGKAGDVSALDAIPGLSEVHRTYRDKLVRNTHRLTHRFDGSLDAAIEAAEAAGRVVHVEFEGGHVVAGVAPANHRLRFLRAVEVNDNATTRMLDLLCRSMEGSPIQELAEHGALRVENWLRTPDLPLPVRGIVTPQNAGTSFDALARMARALFRTYRDQFDVEVRRNTAEQPVSKEWTVLTEKERIERLSERLAQYLVQHGPAGASATVLTLNTPTQVILELGGCENEAIKRTLLRQLEAELKSTVEQRIELYLPTAQDRLKRNAISDLM